MQKIPTLFVRDYVTHLVTEEIHPDAAWMLDRSITRVATRKYDGTCVMMDWDRVWWARREVKAGAPWPHGFELEQEDKVTHKTMGWEPIAQSPFYSRWIEAWGEQSITQAGLIEPGTFELCGPKINGNPEGFDHHVLIAHGFHELYDVGPDYDQLKVYLEHFTGEGIVWWGEGGRRAKIKRKDFWR